MFHFHLSNYQNPINVNDVSFRFALYLERCIELVKNYVFSEKLVVLI